MKPFHFYTPQAKSQAAKPLMAKPRMTGDRRFGAPTQPLANRDVIRSADLLALVIFGGQAKTLTSFGSAYEAGLGTAIQSLPGTIGTAGNGTNLAAGIRLANDLLANTPRGLLRRAWVLSDGVDNAEEDRLFTEVDRSLALHVNVNTIGFGDPTSLNEPRLRAVAKGTHNGRYVPVTTARALGQVWQRNGGSPPASHRGEATVFVVDASPSMEEAMEGSTKIAIVRDTLAQLVIYKQKLWS